MHVSARRVTAFPYDRTLAGDAMRPFALPTPDTTNSFHNELMSSVLGERGQGSGEEGRCSALKPIHFSLCCCWSQPSVDRCGAAPRTRSEWALAVGSPRLCDCRPRPPTMFCYAYDSQSGLVVPITTTCSQIGWKDGSGNLQGVLKMKIYFLRTNQRFSEPHSNFQNGRSFSRTDNLGY